MEVFMQNFLYKRRGLLAGLATMAFLGVFVLGLMRLCAYTVQLYNKQFVTATQTDLGDPVIAYYDAALESYRAGDFGWAARMASQAYFKLAQEGEISTRSDRVQEEAGDIQFLLGLCHEKAKQKTQAIDAYKQALRHNPNHLEAKFNLERLLNPQGGNGAPGGKPEQPGSGDGAGHEGKKGI
jgi:tetratricopeptide (TPR) repeat protein